MRYGWLFIIPLVAIVAIVGVLYIRHRKLQAMKKKKNKKITYAQIANTRNIRDLPEYKSARRTYRTLLILATILFATSVTSLTVLASRPIEITELRSAKENRDVMLCLDVSGSMYDAIGETSEYFSSILDKLNGERIGITLFDGAYATVSPLSDDYSALRDIINDIQRSMSNYASILRGDSSSQIGTGVVGCVDGFDRISEAERSRSIILVTDNESGDKTLSLMDAAKYAKRFEITIYGLDNNSYYGGKNQDEFLNAALLTGGAYYDINGLGKEATIASIIERILEQEAARYDGAKQLVKTDTPEIVGIVSAISLIAFMFIIWRLRL